VLKRSKIDGAAKDVGATPVARPYLIVSDSPNSCELLGRLIESRGWTATRCHDTGEASRLLSETTAEFAGVVIDLNDGVTAGLPVLDTARQQPGARGSIPVVGLSALPDDEALAWRAGFDAILIRPFHANAFLDELGAVGNRTADERTAHRAEKVAQF
jgi:DNA-binding response OmpR family regulator